MSSPTGWIGLTLDGEHLPIATQQPAVRAREIKSMQTSGPGGTREQLAWKPAGYPVRTYKVTVLLPFAHLRNYFDKIEEILAGPGPFELCIWKPVHLRYLGDGARTEFYLPHELGVATDSLTPPGGASVTPFLPEVKIGLAGTPLTYTKVDSATYATGPSAGNVYFLDGGTSFKLPSAPAEDADVVVRYVPLYSVIESAAPAEKRYTDNAREPRSIELVER